MQKIIGKFIGKSIMKTGTNEYGNWQLIEFFIKKSKKIGNKSKDLTIVFTAMGKQASFVETIPIGERIVVHYYPKCTQNNNYWNTNLRATEVEKHVKRNVIPIYLGDELANKEAYFMKDSEEFNFSKKEEEAPIKVPEFKPTQCSECGCETNGVSKCGICEFQ